MRQSPARATGCAHGLVFGWQVLGTCLQSLFGCEIILRAPSHSCFPTLSSIVTGMHTSHQQLLQAFLERMVNTLEGYLVKDTWRSQFCNNFARLWDTNRFTWWRETALSFLSETATHGQLKFLSVLATELVRFLPFGCLHVWGLRTQTGPSTTRTSAKLRRAAESYRQSPQSPVRMEHWDILSEETTNFRNTNQTYKTYMLSLTGSLLKSSQEGKRTKNPTTETGKVAMA